MRIAFLAACAIAVGLQRSTINNSTAAGTSRSMDCLRHAVGGWKCLALALLISRASLSALRWRWWKRSPRSQFPTASCDLRIESRFRQNRPEKGVYWARLEDGKLKGTFEIEGDPSTYLEWTGVRAPVLPEKDDAHLETRRSCGSVRRPRSDRLANGAARCGPLGWTVKEGILTASGSAHHESDLGKEILEFRGGGGVPNRAARQQRDRACAAAMKCKSPTMPTVPSPIGPAGQF